MRWRCRTVAELRLLRRTCTDDDEHAQERSGETAAAVAVDEMSERERGEGVMLDDMGGRQRHRAASSCCYGDTTTCSNKGCGEKHKKEERDIQTDRQRARRKE